MQVHGRPPLGLSLTNDSLSRRPPPAALVSFVFFAALYLAVYPFAKRRGDECGHREYQEDIIESEKE
jgi:hypothetical protein